MQAQTSQQCVVVSFDTYCMNARGKINIYDIPILSCNILLDNPNLANLVSRHVLKGKPVLFGVIQVKRPKNVVFHHIHSSQILINLK